MTQMNALAKPDIDDASAARQTALAGRRPPLLARSDFDAPSVFDPSNMLREARRQKNLAVGDVPSVCILDPDGDIVDYVRRTRAATRSPHWACYHTELWEWMEGEARFGVVGRAVGAPFAVLVAEQLFSSGCGFVISLASAGRIAGQDAAERYILIDRALRDEGTSYHYLPPSDFAFADAKLVEDVYRAIGGDACIEVGATWTTDAPFRETAKAIETSRASGALAVEMEAAALYAFAQARGRPILCVAHLTNCLGLVEGDFEKGEANGAARSLAIVLAISKARSFGDVKPNLDCLAENGSQLRIAEPSAPGAAKADRPQVRCELGAILPSPPQPALVESKAPFQPSH